MIDPIGNRAILNLIATAYGVQTDSGGLQQATTALRVRYRTLRPHTDGPMAIIEGTNRLVMEALEHLTLVRKAKRMVDRTPREEWDRLAGQRMVAALNARPA